MKPTLLLRYFLLFILTSTMIPQRSNAQSANQPNEQSDALAKAAESNPPKSPEQSYLESIEQWRKSHETKFCSPNGWLALTGHYPLRQGENRIGSSLDDYIRLPEGLGEKATATVYLIGDVVELHVPAGSPMTVNGEVVAMKRLQLNSDEEESDCKDVIRVADRVTLQYVRRVGKAAIRVRDSESELLKNFKGKNWFAPDPMFRVTAKFVRRSNPLVAKIKNIKGDTIESKFAGTLEFELLGQKIQLEAISEPPNSLFVIFKDKTSGSSTYAAGRFLDVELPEQGDQVVVDFNKAYQPPCAFSPHTLCPLPPKQNQLDIAITAGEKKQ